MSDELASFIESLPSLDGNLPDDQLVENASIAYQRYSALSPEMQQRVMQEANTRLGITPEKLQSFTPDERTTRVYNGAMNRTKARSANKPQTEAAPKPASSSEPRSTPNTTNPRDPAYSFAAAWANSPEVQQARARDASQASYSLTPSRR